jgi:hypothetical protein
MGMRHQVAKDSSECDKCPIEGMQYLLLALMYLGGDFIHSVVGGKLSGAKESGLIVTNCHCKTYVWVKLVAVKDASYQTRMRLKKRVVKPIGGRRGRLSGSYVIEEASFQVIRLLKQQVVRPVSILSR